MAAEYQAPEQTAEEISQLLYHVQVIMIARGLTWTDVYSTFTRSEALARPNARTEAEGPQRHAAHRRCPTRVRSRSRPRRCCTRPATGSARTAKELVLVDPDNDVELFFLRPRDIAVYVGSGRLDVGITGRDLLLDSGAPAEEILALGFGGSTFRFAATPATARGQGRRRPGGPAARIATSYTGLVEQHLAEHGVRADGDQARRRGRDRDRSSGVADVIADVVRQRDDACGRPAWRSSASRSWSPRRC